MSNTCRDCIHYDCCCGWTSKEAIDSTYEGIENGSCRECDYFKDKSRMVELPLDLGDVVYPIYYPGYVEEEEVVNISICDMKDKNENLIYTNRDKFNSTGDVIACIDNVYTFAEIGKTVFLTKSEAENALADGKSAYFC